MAHVRASEWQREDRTHMFVGADRSRLWCAGEVEGLQAKDAFAFCPGIGDETLRFSDRGLSVLGHRSSHFLNIMSLILSFFPHDRDASRVLHASSDSRIRKRSHKAVLHYTTVPCVSCTLMTDSLAKILPAPPSTGVV